MYTVTYREEETSEKPRWHTVLFILSRMLTNGLFCLEIYLNTCIFSVCLTSSRFVFRNASWYNLPLDSTQQTNFVRKHCGSKYLAPFINTQLTVDRTLCSGYSGGMGKIYSFLYQVMSPVVKQCDRKSVQL